jgi:hypothetical protein
MRKLDRKIRQRNSNNKVRKPNKLTTRVQQNISPTAGQTKKTATAHQENPTSQLQQKIA